VCFEVIQAAATASGSETTGQKAGAVLGARLTTRSSAEKLSRTPVKSWSVPRIWAKTAHFTSHTCAQNGHLPPPSDKAENGSDVRERASAAAAAASAAA
jgi:hypothetical protein